MTHLLAPPNVRGAQTRPEFFSFFARYLDFFGGRVCAHACAREREQVECVRQGQG